MTKIDKTDIENIKLIIKETKIGNVSNFKIKKGDYEIEISSQPLITPNISIPKESLVIGVPGKVIRKVNKSETDEILQRAKDYIDLSNEYKKIYKDKSQ